MKYSLQAILLYYFVINIFQIEFDMGEDTLVRLHLDWWSSNILFKQVLIANIKEYAPIVYTPTVGLVCQNYGGLFRRPRGMYFSAEDRGEMMSMVYNWPAEQVCGIF